MSVQRNDWSLQRKGIIDQDRHKERIKEAIRKNLGSIVSNESIILSNGRRTVKVPMRALDEYKFRFDHRKRKHVGQGDGKTKVGDVIARENEPGHGQGAGQAGDNPGQDFYEADVDIDDIAAMIFEDLHLPFLEEKAKQAVQSKTTKFTEIRRVGALSNLDKRRTILENIRRNAREQGQAKIGGFKKEDMRFKSWEEEIRYESNAAVIAMMDVSGCFAAGHLVEMADGTYKDISEINVGDRVACLNLQTRRKTQSSVVSTFTKQAPQTFLIESEDAALRATPEHVFFVYDEKTNQIAERKARDLQPGDKLILVNSWGKHAEGVENTAKQITADQAYLLGVLLGDGHLRMPSKPLTYGTYLAITDKSLKRLQMYQGLFQTAYCVQGIIKEKQREQSRQRLHVNSSSLVRELAGDYPMLVHRSPQRYIEPSIYAQAPEVRAAFLRGLFDAEGTVAHQGVMFYSSSEKLVRQIKHLLSFWGIRARTTSFTQDSKRMNGHTIKEGTYYSLTVNAKDAIRFQSAVGFACAEKATKLAALVARQQKGIDAMRSKFIMPFDWRKQFEHLYNATRTYAYYRPDLHALSAAQLHTIAADPRATTGDLQVIDDVLGSQLLVSKIKKIELQDAPVAVYDFEVADHHNYIVDGILSHNSMGEFKKYIARSFFFWMVRFLRTKYDQVKIVFISHHTEAKEVTEEQFFTQGESGGTVVSSAYKLALDIIAERFPPRDWNVYPFHFSDGDNYYSDNEDAVKMADQLIETCNLFGYGEIGEEGMATYRRSSGALLSIFNDRLKNKERFIGVRIDDKEDVYPALKEFFGKRGVEA
jgi:uncharacterized sporulation protein YeaH/YhbH (DUF444 family)/DNA-binding transcriptional regulator WhiA